MEEGDTCELSSWLLLLVVVVVFMVVVVGSRQSFSKLLLNDAESSFKISVLL